MSQDDRSSRNRVLRAASKLFAMHGFCGTSVRQIASRARVNEVTVFRLFISKRALYERVLENKLARAASLISKQDEADGHDELLHSLAGDLQQLFDPELTRLLTFAALEEPRLMRKWVSPRMERYYEVIGSYLTKLMTRGVIRSADPRIMAQALVALVLYDRVSNDILANCSDSSEDSQKHTASLIDIWLNGVSEQSALHWAARTSRSTS